MPSVDKALDLAVSKKLFFASSEFSEGVCDTVFHGFFGRGGGVSRGIYAGLNCGAGSDDAREAVLQNRAIVAAAAGCAPEGLLSLHQVHGDGCIVVDRPWGLDERPQGDCFVTDARGVALGILTADCAPVLFYGEKADGAPVVGAAHAGWGGALRGVLASTVEGMVRLGVERDSLRACVGPCIAQVSYEVQEQFSAPFLEEDEENERFFMGGQKDGHLLFDLSGYCAFKLYKAGLKRVFLQDLDTYCDEDNFYSYRRTTHRHEVDYGRQISVIMIGGGDK